MSIGGCDICGIWDSELVEGVCPECTRKYSDNVIDAREAFNKALEYPNTRIIKLQQLAKLARISVVCTFDDDEG